MPAVLEITLVIPEENRSAAVGVYTNLRQRFLDEASGAQSKQLLVRKEDVQVLHGFDSAENAQAYLESALFTQDVVGELGPLLDADPVVSIYNVVG